MRNSGTRSIHPTNSREYRVLRKAQDVPECPVDRSSRLPRHLHAENWVTCRTAHGKQCVEKKNRINKTNRLAINIGSCRKYRKWKHINPPECPVDHSTRSSRNLHAENWVAYRAPHGPEWGCGTASPDQSTRQIGVQYGVLHKMKDVSRVSSIIPPDRPDICMQKTG